MNIKAEKAVDNEIINASANAKDVKAEDAYAKDAIVNATINEEAPAEDVENLFTDSLKTINVESRKVGPSKLTSRWKSLKKLIRLVVHTTGHITGNSVSMVRWAGRAFMVIMNQEENNLNINTVRVTRMSTTQC